MSCVANTRELKEPLLKAPCKPEKEVKLPFGEPLLWQPEAVQFELIILEMPVLYAKFDPSQTGVNTSSSSLLQEKTTTTTRKSKYFIARINIKYKHKKIRERSNFDIQKGALRIS